MISRARLQELLEYDYSTGIFRWRVSRGGTAHAGSVAGCQASGYIQIYIDNQKYYAHRLAWFYTHDKWPKEVDHINGIKSDNRIENLRGVTHQENHFNRRANKNNTLGHKGVCKHGTGFMANIWINGRNLYIGKYKTKEEAINAREEKAKELHGELYT